MDTIELELIKNRYNLQDAREVLNHLLTDKIRFLRMKKLRSVVHFEESPTKIDSRLTELEEAKDQLNAFFANLQNSNYEVEIDCPIQIKLHTVEASSSTADHNAHVA